MVVNDGHFEKPENIRVFQIQFNPDVLPFLQNYHAAKSAIRGHGSTYSPQVDGIRTTFSAQCVGILGTLFPQGKWEIQIFQPRTTHPHTAPNSSHYHLSFHTGKVGRWARNVKQESVPKINQKASILYTFTRN